MAEPITPNMNLFQPITGITPGSTANDEYNANWSTIDQHDHAPGRGVPITPSSFNINADLPFNGNNATLLRSARFSVQSAALAGASDLACLYFSGLDLWCNDASGNQIQITSGGNVNATSSGISSGTATASFVTSVLVVNAASNKPANIQGGSLLLGNNVTSSHYLTLSPPNAMAADYGLVLPSIPGVNSIVGIDTSGNITAAYTVDNSTIDINGSSQIEVKALGIGTAQLAAGSVTADKLAALGQQVSAGSGSGSISTNTLTDITNCSVTITTTGRPVYVFLTSANANSTGNSSISGGGSNQVGSGNFFLLRDGTIIATFSVGAAALAGASTAVAATLPPSVIQFLDTGASAASHTYKAQYKADTVGNPGSTAGYTNVKLVAYEVG